MQTNIAKKLSSSRTVLVVDDERTICDTLCGILRDEGYVAESALSGYDAVERVVALQPELVFLDIWMPGLDGIETLERIKSLSPATEVVMISGHATISNALEATKRGAFDFIEKPLDLDSILLSAARAIEKRDLSATDGNVLETKAPRSIDSLQPLLQHVGAFSKGCAGENLGQRTLRRSAILYGQCLHSGQKSGLVLEPLPRDSGIHFAKIGDSRSVPAYVDFVESTAYATKLSAGSISVSTIEHLLAALHSYRISNLLIKCNAEVPILDGSALEFCRAIEEAGLEEQGGDWFEIAIDKEIEFVSATNPAERIKLSPADRCIVEYDLNYPRPVGRQTYSFEYRDVESFKREIAPARTFGFLRDIGRLQKAGLAAGGRLDNFILIGDDRIVNTELRFPNELARHKILDILGDLFLIGRPIRARITAAMTGHSDNVQVLKALREAIGLQGN